MFARVLVACSLLALVAGCGSTRYLGHLGDAGVYGNRGYGLSVLLARDELLARWSLVETGPDAPLPAREPLDINGDGVLEPYETHAFTRPTLRLIRRGSGTASVSPARIDLDVRIVGYPQRARALSVWADQLTEELLGAAAVERVARAPLGGRPAEERRRGASRLVVIDQPEYAHEWNAGKRRQLVVVVLRAATESELLERDFEAFLGAIALTDVAPPLTRQEQP